MSDFGSLFVVATPIGNLGDITLRALETLKQVDLIAAEDTRHSKKLLEHYGINTPLISLHNYNETKRCQLILTRLQQGKNLALITDAGTPLISDPGYQVVKLVRENGLRVIPIPGPCAAIAALSVSGLPTDRFIFIGFLSPKSKQQQECLQELVDEAGTMIFYESPHRLLATINNMQTVFGNDRYAVLAKEVTKIFEIIYGDTLMGLRDWLTEKPERQKGEFVILIKGVSQKLAINQETWRILNLLLKNMSKKQAVIITAKITGVSKNELYKLANI